MISGTGVGIAATVSRTHHAAAAAPDVKCPTFTGAPPLVIDLPGAPARASNAALTAYARSRLPAADMRVRVADVIANYTSAGAAATVTALRRLPQNQAVVVTNLGLVQLWSGRCQAAVGSLDAAKRLDPYGYYGTDADNLLHPDERRGYPFYYPPVDMPARTLPQLQAAIEADPTSPGPLLALAYAVQIADRSASVIAARAALRLDPHGIDAQVAVAVLTFDKNSPQTAISTLQALSARYPDDPEVGFHLALLESWVCSETQDAQAQFSQIVHSDARSIYSRYARTHENEPGCTT